MVTSGSEQKFNFVSNKQLDRKNLQHCFFFGTINQSSLQQKKRAISLDDPFTFNQCKQTLNLLSPN